MSPLARKGMAALFLLVAALAGIAAAMLLSAWAVGGTLEIVPLAIFGIASVSALALVVQIYRTSEIDGARAAIRVAATLLIAAIRRAHASLEDAWGEELVDELPVAPARRH